MISFNGYKNNTVTMENYDAQIGSPVGVSNDSKATDATEKQTFIGVCVAVRGNLCSVQTDGYIELAYAGTKPEFGLSGFVADGNGGVEAIAAESAIKVYTVVKVDEDRKIVGFIM